jgi:hypothetical protein
MRFFILLIIICQFGFAFLKVSGNQIIDEKGRLVILKGYALENGIFSKWDDQAKKCIMPDNSSEQEWVITEDDVVALRKDGVSAVRYCVNYELFSKDNSASQNNFAIFEKRLSWFEKNGINVVFNLHVPPGFAGQIRPDQKSIFEDAKYWQEFEQFWREILTRYKDKEVIAGWEFFNEPYLPVPSGNETTDAWYQKVDSFLKEMRAIDKEHIFFVCNPIAQTLRINNDGSRIVDWKIIPFKYRYADKNLVYVFHFYEPLNFTHQATNEFMVSGVKYPWVGFDYKEYLSSTGGSYIADEKNGWLRVVISGMEPPAGADYGTPVLSANLGKGKVIFDDVRIFEVRDGRHQELNLPNKNFVPAWPKVDKLLDNKRLLTEEKFIHWNNYYSDKYLPSRDNSKIPQFVLETAKGVDGDDYALSIQNDQQQLANWNTDPKQFLIRPKPKYSYTMQAWVQGTPDSFWLGVSWYKGNKVVYNKKYLEKIISENYLSFAKENNVPLYVSEFGSVAYADLDSRVRWTKDVLEIFKENNISYAYWDYNGKYGWGYDFGLKLKDPYRFDKEFIEYKELLKLNKEYF